MGSLRSRIIRLAYSQPHLRSHLLPILKKASDPELVYTQALLTISYLWKLNGNIRAVFGRYQLNPGDKPDMDLIDEARRGAEMARSTRTTLAGIVDLYPTNNRYIIAYTDANKVDVAMAESIELLKIAIKSGR